MTDDEPIDTLLVEDDPGDAALTREAFDEGCIKSTLHTVTDGITALDFLHQRGDYVDAPRPQLVLLDLNLPRKEGVDVLEDVEEDPDLEHVPVVVLTSSESKGDLARAYSHHANAYLTKPVDPFEFIQMIDELEEFWFSIVRSPDPRSESTRRTTA